MRGGKCVRLIQGDYNQETIYGDSPFDMAKSFKDAGATWIHMVDLDGAKDGKRVNDSFVVRAAKELGAHVQIGGGIRTEEDVVHYLENGVERVIIGSMAISDPEFAIEMIKKYGEKIAIGIDAKNGYVATHGWLKHQKQKQLMLVNNLLMLVRRRLFLLILQQMGCFLVQILKRKTNGNGNG